MNLEFEDIKENLMRLDEQIKENLCKFKQISKEANKWEEINSRPFQILGRLKGQ